MNQKKKFSGNPNLHFSGFDEKEDKMIIQEYQDVEDNKEQIALTDLSKKKNYI